MIEELITNHSLCVTENFFVENESYLLQYALQVV